MRKQAWLMGGLVALVLGGVALQWRPREVRADNAAAAREAPPEGVACIVYLRRDQVATFVKEETSGIEMVDTATGTSFMRKYVTGTLRRVNDQWVVVQQDNSGHQMWIPRAAVVAIDVNTK